MKKVSMLLAMAAMVFGTQMAQAKVEAPLWDCTFSFNVEGGGLKLFVGKFDLEGPGMISCMDITGQTEELPVYVTVGGKPVSLSVGIGRIQLVGLAKGIGIAGEPQDLLGQYFVAGIRGSVFIGAGADVALRASHRSLTLNTSLQAVSGFGLNGGVETLTIERL